VSTWDEKANAAAVANRHAMYEADEWFSYSSESDARDDGFVEGARWREKQMLSDETVERVARKLDPQVWRLVDEGCTVSGMDALVRVSRNQARAVLTAALGEEE
jgi:hypothetical protein